MSEILSRIMKLKTKEERTEAFRDAQRPAFVKLIQHAIDDRIKWDLPPGRPPYKALFKEEDMQHVLYQRIRMFDYFITANHPNMRPWKREQIFINLLEMVDPDDAELLVMVKDKKIRYHGKNLTKSFVLEAWNGRVEGIMQWWQVKKKDS